MKHHILFYFAFFLKRMETLNKKQLAEIAELNSSKISTREKSNCSTNGIRGIHMDASNQEMEGTVCRRKQKWRTFLFLRENRNKPP